MNREILFRGKRLDTGEWVEGFYLVKTDPLLGTKKHFILCQDITPNGVLNSMLSWYVVDPATVGQFTGMTDKNGKKIFEGDIVVICYESNCEDYCETKKVHYNSEECCWYPMRWEECCEYCDNYTEIKSMEVIGNIHDNPELLEDDE